MVPVQHHRGEPAAGAGCDRCRTHPHDHTPAGQSKTHNYPIANSAATSPLIVRSDATKEVHFEFRDTSG